MTQTVLYQLRKKNDYISDWNFLQRGQLTTKEVRSGNSSKLRLFTCVLNEKKVEDQTERQRNKNPPNCK